MDSMRHLGWNKLLPAYVDEDGVILDGHSRLEIAAELGIEPVIEVKILGGEGDERAERRKKFYMAANTCAPFSLADMRGILDRINCVTETELYEKITRHKNDD
jgi:hypothetical protein